MRFLITRPQEDARPLAQHLEEMGHQAVIEPLLRIRFLETPAENMVRLLDGAQALLATSANGVRAFAGVSSRRDLAVYAVGEASARAARSAGFDRVESAAGDVATLAEKVVECLRPEAGALVHVAGTRVAGDLSGMLGSAGFEVRRAVLYEAVKAERLSPDVSADIAGGAFDGVLLFSPRTAESFVDLIVKGGLSEACRGLTVHCLSEAVVQKVSPLDWREVRVAAHPDQQSLIETLNQ